MRLTELVHKLLDIQVHPGDSVIDATSGNGHDSGKLASLIGACGHLHAIDIQAPAIAATKKLLENSGFDHCYTLYCDDHGAVLRAMQAKHQHRISAIVFNLGYLPGSDHTIQTNSTTTITALDACLPLLCQNGLLLVTAYRGHPGGMEEAEKVEKWMQQRKSCKGWKIEQVAPRAASPRVAPILWQVFSPIVSK